MPRFMKRSARFSIMTEYSENAVESSGQASNEPSSRPLKRKAAIACEMRMKELFNSSRKSKSPAKKRARKTAGKRSGGSIAHGRNGLLNKSTGAKVNSGLVGTIRVIGVEYDVPNQDQNPKVPGEPIKVKNEVLDEDDMMAQKVKTGQEDTADLPAVDKVKTENVDDEEMPSTSKNQPKAKKN